MRWRWSRTVEATRAAPDRLVLTVTDPITRATAPSLVARVGRIAAANPVVIDLTAIPDFDSEGAAAIIKLQESYGSDRVSVIGFKRAAARIVGAADVQVTPAAAVPVASRASGWAVRKLRAIAVVQAEDGQRVTTDDLEPALTKAIESYASIVVADLRGVTVTPLGLQAIAFASSTVALNGQELLVVNADADTAEHLRRAGLSQSTFIAPEPLGDA